MYYAKQATNIYGHIGRGGVLRLQAKLGRAWQRITYWVFILVVKLNKPVIHFIIFQIKLGPTYPCSGLNSKQLEQSSPNTVHITNKTFFWFFLGFKQCFPNLYTSTNQKSNYLDLIPLNFSRYPQNYIRPYKQDYFLVFLIVQ